MSQYCASGQPEARILTHHEPERELTAEQVEIEEVRKYIRFLPQVPEPNLARVREIKEQLRQGVYAITSEMVEETAARLTLRFLRQE